MYILHEYILYTFTGTRVKIDLISTHMLLMCLIRSQRLFVNILPCIVIKTKKTFCASIGYAKRALSNVLLSYKTFLTTDFIYYCSLCKL